MLEQGAPGANYQLSAGHTQKVDYGTNVASEVRLWTVTANGATGTTFYQPGTLYKTVSKDENHRAVTDGKLGTVEEFKDLEGRVVLKKTYNDAGLALYTYYVYDDFGNLRYVLPPGVNETGLNTFSSFTEADDMFKKMIYGYHYDGRNRVVEKKIPSKDLEYLVYNKLDQLVLSQDGLQRATGKWLFTKYDAFGRLVMTGLYTNASSRVVLDTAVNNQAVLWETRVTTGEGYNNASFPQTFSFHHSIAKVLCENMNKETFESFANWQIYKRGEQQDTFIVCDYNKSELSSRFLIIHKSSFLVKSIAPQKDSTFSVLRNYPETQLNDLSIKKEQFELNMKLYRKLNVDKILYRKEFDGLIISKGNVSAIKLLSDKLIDKVPKNYKLLNKSCYYY